MFTLLGILAAKLLDSFTDIFSSRTNTTTGLGTSTDGNIWTQVTGNLIVSSGAATATATPTIVSTTRSSGGTSGTNTVTVASTTGIAIGQRITGLNIPADTVVSAINGSVITVSKNFTGNVSGTLLFLSANSTEYSMATQDMANVNNIIELKGANEGSAVALWVQSSSDWWMVGVDSVRNTTPGNYYAGTPPTYTPGSYFSYWSPNAGYVYGTNPPTYTPGNPSGTNPATYSFSQYLRISKSVSSVVSTVTSLAVSTSSVIRSLRVTLNSNQITARAFSDTNLVTQLGSDLVYTATGAIVNTQYGIAISPSAYQQSPTIGTALTITKV